MFQPLPDRVDLVTWDGGIGCGGESFRLSLRQLQHGSVAQQVGDSELGQTGLSGAEELAGTALLEVELCQFKAVLGGKHGVEPRVGLLRDALPSHQDAVALRGSPANTPAK